MTGNIHLKQAFKDLRFKLILLCIIMFSTLIMFSLMGTSVQIQDNMLHDFDTMPEFAKKMMGEGLIQSAVKYGIIMVGYLHPAILVIFILFIFMTASHMLTSEITSGTIGFTLSKPLSRKRLFTNVIIVIYTGTALIALSAFISTYIGIIFFHKGKFAITPFVNISWNLFLLMIFVAGYLMIFAAFADTGKELYTYGGVSLFILYLLSFIAPIWKPLAYIAPVSPFTYYKPLTLLMGKRIDLITSLSLISVSIIMLLIAMTIFNRRDISNG